MTRGPRHSGGAVRVALVVLLACLGQGARGDAPLSAADVVRFLKAGISERTILTELEGRGFGEPLDAARETALREAGASETLVVAVRRAAPAATPAVTASAAPAGAGPAAPALPAIPTATFAAGTRTVRVPVSVLDRSGQPMLGLSMENFRISDDGQRQPVTLFSAERRALRIALALDVSGSMLSKIRQVEQALRYFIDLLEPQDEIMVLTFNDRVRVRQDFTSDREQLARVLDMLEPVGATALFDAAAEAIRRVSAGPAESKAVVLVTDGVDTESATTFEALRDLARRSEVPVYSIGLDSGGDVADNVSPIGRSGPGIGRPRIPGGGGRGPGGRGPGGRGPGGRGPGGRGPGGGGPGIGGPGGGGPGGWPGGQPGGQPGGAGGGRPGKGGAVGRPVGFDAKPLNELADETGGRALIIRDFGHYTPGSDAAPGSEQLKSAVESIAITLRHRYLVGYEPPEGKRGWHAIRVEVDRPTATARARKGYYAGA